MHAQRPWRRVMRTPLAVGALAATLAFIGPVGPADAQARPANIRLAHLSPDTPEMDVYVVGFDGAETRVLEGLGYGEVSDYASLEPGSYTFLLRPMGAPADSTPAVTASADLTDGAAYTFAAMGPHAQLQKALLTDDLAPPPAGQAKVRLIQASSSAGEVDVAVVDGPALAENRPFASATDYAPVAAGDWVVQVTTGDGTQFQRRLGLEAGTVNTLVVLEGTGSGPELTRIVDATGVDASGSSGGALGLTQAVPLGGVGTGGGATAASVVDSPAGGGSDGVLVKVVLMLGLAAAVAVTIVLTGSRMAGRRAA